MIGVCFIRSEGKSMRRFAIVGRQEVTVIALRIGAFIWNGPRSKLFWRKPKRASELSKGRKGGPSSPPFGISQRAQLNCRSLGEFVLAPSPPASEMTNPLANHQKLLLVAWHGRLKPWSLLKGSIEYQHNEDITKLE